MNMCEKKSSESESSEIANRAYRYLLQVRDVDNQLMWTRSNIILIVQGGLLAILASKFDVLAENYRLLLAILCLFGIAISYLWWRITKGSSFWVTYWQEKLKDAESSALGQTVEIFRKHPTKNQENVWQTIFGKQEHVSTHKILIYITFLAIFLWVLLLIYVIASPLCSLWLS